MSLELTRETAIRVLEVVDQGLTCGLGEPVPGKMCVEAAICYALELPHGDEPGCVAVCIRRYKISINDAPWSSNEARAAGMRRAAIAQLGSDNIDQKEWCKFVVEQIIRRIFPIGLRVIAADKRTTPTNRVELEAAAKECESEGTLASARSARKCMPAAYVAADAAYVAADAAYYDVADYVAYAAAADYVADYAAYYDVAAYVADYAAYVAAFVAYAAADYVAAYVADYAAYVAAFVAAYAAAGSASRAEQQDHILKIAAEICVEACVHCGTQGSEWLDLVAV